MRTILLSWFLTAMIVAAGVPAAASEPETPARVSVVFVKPEGFTDAGYAKTERSSPAILLRLQRFIADTGARYLPESMRLEIKITDIDLAGDFELFRGPQFEHVRVNKSIYPPRIALEFRVVDAGDRIIKEGQPQLTDLDYQLRVDYPREDPLRYEKEILRDWLRSELNVLQAGKAD
jgi:Protein of unknown function (DUF3016)